MSKTKSENNMFFHYWNLNGTPCPFFIAEAAGILEADKVFKGVPGKDPVKLSHIVVRFTPEVIAPPKIIEKSKTFFYNDMLKLLDDADKRYKRKRELEEQRMAKSKK